MDLDNIENLNEEQILELFTDIVEVKTESIASCIGGYSSACRCGCTYSGFNSQGSDDYICLRCK